jgi:large subunit ribosomal protein L17
MRHGKRINHLGRTTPHRKALLSNLASSLLLHKRINTTLAKAKALRKYVEPLITKAKNDTTHTRRVVFSYLQNKESLKALYNEVVDRVGERPGGYTRIIKLGTRLGDSAEMAMIELVDFNEFLTEEKDTKKTRTRRSRRGGKKEASEVQETSAGKKQGKAEAKKNEAKTVQDETPETLEAEEGSGSEENPEATAENAPETQAAMETEKEEETGEVKAEAAEQEEKAPEDEEKDEEDGKKQEE